MQKYKYVNKRVVNDTSEFYLGIAILTINALAVIIYIWFFFFEPVESTTIYYVVMFVFNIFGVCYGSFKIHNSTTTKKVRMTLTKKDELLL